VIILDYTLKVNLMLWLRSFLGYDNALGMGGKFRFRRTTLLIVAMVAFLCGLGLARTHIAIAGSWIWLSLMLAVVVLRQKRFASLFFIALLGLSLGWWRGSVYIRQLSAYQPLIKRPVIMTAQADTDAIYSKSQLSFDVRRIHVQEPIRATLVGKMGIKGFGERAVYRGDILQIEGKLYPTRGSRQASISYAQLKVLQRSHSTIENLRRRFQTGMLSALPEPLASFGLGLLIGQRNTLPQTATEQLKSVGLTHIVAVSGYNLTIIMSAVYLVLKKRSKYQSTILSLGLIGLFLLFTGFSPSIVRAAIVSGLSICALYYGHRFRPLLLLLLAATMTAGWYPIYIWADIGWYLSFLAFFGVLIIGPLIIKRIYDKKQPRLITTVVIATLSAQLMTLPLIMYIFGEVSLIALPANVLIVPLVPLAMAVSFVAALGGMLVPSVAGWLAWPAKILLTYMLDMVNLLARIPHALTQRRLSLTYMVLFYAIIAACTLIIWSKVKKKNGIITSKQAEAVTGQADIK